MCNLAELFRQIVCYLAVLFRQIVYYLVDLFHQIVCYLVELFCQIVYYLVELFRQIAFLYFIRKGLSRIICNLSLLEKTALISEFISSSMLLQVFNLCCLSEHSCSTIMESGKKHLYSNVQKQTFPTWMHFYRHFYPATVSTVSKFFYQISNVHVVGFLSINFHSEPPEWISIRITQ